MANEILDLDAVVVDRITVRKRLPGETEPHEWALRDDVPPEIMLRVFRLMKHGEDASKMVQEIVAGANQKDADAVVAATDQIERLLLDQAEETLSIALGIFQHSYPEVTAEQLRGWFTRKEVEGIVRLFFLRLLNGSSNASSAATPNATNSSSQPTQNRAARRKKAGQSPSSGAIPSQKRLKRELGL